jgi:L-lactate dehydrogenase complex protein LldF
MIAEEVGLNDFLSEHGITPIETDLGEYIIQLRHEMPSHIIAPAVHLSKAQVEADFRRVHTGLAPDRDLTQPEKLLAEAREILREKFLSADVGITGANFLIAETGTSIIVTNEGNGDLTQTLPRAHIVLTSVEKLVPTLKMPRSSCASLRAQPPDRKCPSIPRSPRGRGAMAIPMARASIT